MAKGTIMLPVTAAKISGDFITNPARIDNGLGGGALLFAADQTESAMWVFRMPENYGSALTAKLQYSMASATSGKVDMEVEVMAVSDGDSQDLDTASFAAVNEIAGGTTVPGTAGYLDEISITLSNADSLTAGDLVYIRINRDHDDTDDTAAGDLEMRALSLEYTI